MLNIKLYQVNTDRDKDRVAFWGLSTLARFQGSDKINSSIYDKVYEGTVDATTLEDVYRIFNLEHPADFRGRSLSVSDVVQVISDASDKNFYFCDSIGFTRVAFEPEKTQTVLPAQQGPEAAVGAVFLCAQPDATWKAFIGSEAPEGFVKLCNTGEYPVHLYYARTDANGSNVFELDTCKDQAELLSSLDWLGKCRNTIVALWGYDIEKGIAPGIAKIFTEAYEKKSALAQQEIGSAAPEKVSLKSRVQAVEDKSAPDPVVNETAREGR